MTLYSEQLYSLLMVLHCLQSQSLLSFDPNNFFTFICSCRRRISKVGIDRLYSTILRYFWTCCHSSIALFLTSQMYSHFWSINMWKNLQAKGTGSTDHIVSYRIFTRSNETVFWDSMVAGRVSAHEMLWSQDELYPLERVSCALHKGLLYAHPLDIQKPIWQRKLKCDGRPDSEPVYCPWWFGYFKFRQLIFISTPLAKDSEGACMRSAFIPFFGKKTVLPILVCVPFSILLDRIGKEATQQPSRCEQH